MSIFDKITERVGDILDEVMLPDVVRKAHDEAARALDANDTARALRALQPTLIEHPNIARTHHLIGRAHLVAEEWGHAIAAFERALSIKEHPQSHFYAGLAAERLERWADVHRHYHQALSYPEPLPYEFDLRFGLGRAYRALGRPDKATRELRAALKASPGHVEATTHLVEALLDRDEVDEAAKAVEAISPSDRSEIQLLRAEIAERRNDWSDAFHAFTEAAADPSDVRTRARLGAARNALKLGEFLAAAEILARVEVDDHDDAIEHRILSGRVLEHQGRYYDAREQFEAALERRPDHPDALLGMGRVELLTRDADAAASNFARVLRDPSTERRQEALWGIGQCHRLAGDLAGARHLFEQAIALDGARRIDILRALGETALELGDAAEAIVHLRDALELAAAGEQRDAIERALDDALLRLSFEWTLPETIDEPVKLQEVLDDLTQYLGRDARLADFLAPAQRLRSALDAPLSLAIVGEFNAGKSTIVNALVGEDVFPVGVVPTTAHTGTLRWGPRKAAQIVYLDGTREEQSLEEARRSMKEEAEEIERIEFTHPHPDLRLVHYWDTPGFNAIAERHERVAREALQRAEAILWVMDANQVLSHTEFEIIDSLSAPDERLVVVINKIDRLGGPDARDEEIERLIEYVEDNLDDGVAGIYAISARDATSDDPDVRAAAGFESFRGFLDQRVVQRAGRIKSIEVARQLESLVVTLDAFQAGLIQRYVSLEEHVTALELWLAERAARAPEQTAREEVALMREWVDRTLEGVAHEIADAMRPTSSWTGKLGLLEEDRDFITNLLLERFERLLAASWQRTSSQLGDVEREIAERLDPVVRGLVLADARAVQRRLDGFFDEVRVVELLWEERIYGAASSRARGRIETAGSLALDAIVATQGERSGWTHNLRRLLPELDDELAAGIRDWYAAFFEAGQRFCRRVRKDLELLRLEASHRYDVGPLRELLDRADEETTPEEAAE